MSQSPSHPDPGMTRAGLYHGDAPSSHPCIRLSRSKSGARTCFAVLKCVSFEYVNRTRSEPNHDGIARFSDDRRE